MRDRDIWRGLSGVDQTKFRHSSSVVTNYIVTNKLLTTGNVHTEECLGCGLSFVREFCVQTSHCGSKLICFIKG